MDTKQNANTGTTFEQTGWVTASAFRTAFSLILEHSTFDSKQVRHRISKIRAATSVDLETSDLLPLGNATIYTPACIRASSEEEGLGALGTHQIRLSNALFDVVSRLCCADSLVITGDLKMQATSGCKLQAEGCTIDIRRSIEAQSGDVVTQAALCSEH